jgi:hypothetical protein
MSKFSKSISWVDREFPRKIALEYHRRHRKWQKHTNRSRRYVWRTVYAWMLKRAGRLDDLNKFLDGQAKVRLHEENIRTGKFPRCFDVVKAELTAEYGPDGSYWKKHE